MKTTHRQRADFAASMTSPASLEDAIAWIAENMLVDEVFPKREIELCCSEISEPEDCFGDAELSKWAENNGFVYEDGD